jgi:hypothetical protein
MNEELKTYTLLNIGWCAVAVAIAVIALNLFG